MKIPKKPENEKQRLEALYSYSILDTLPEEDFDNLTAISAEICQTPISLVSLVDKDRQWFKSHHGTDAKETPRDHAFCGHAINEPNELFIIEDARSDDRFADNPLVTGDPHIIFYAGIPLVNENGLALGTLCVIDNKPKQLSPTQKDALKALARQVMIVITLRRQNLLLNETKESLLVRNEELDRFAMLAAHDLKSPLNNITSLSEMLLTDEAHHLSENELKIFSAIHASSIQLRTLVDDLLMHSRSEKLMTKDATTFCLRQLIDEISALFQSQIKLDIVLEPHESELYMNRIWLHRILINLISNSIKYNDHPTVRIIIKCSVSKEGVALNIADNGWGIRESEQDKVFGLFQTAVHADRFGDKPNGVGLATVKKLIESAKGTIGMTSVLGQGTEFNIWIPTIQRT